MNKEIVEIITLSASLLAAGGTVYAALKSSVAASAASKSASISKEQFEHQKEQFEYQIEQFNYQISEREKTERPILTPLSREFEVQTDTIFRDWDSLDRRFNKIGHDNSAFNFEVFNTGNTFALDVKFSFELLDTETSVPELNDEHIKIEKRLEEEFYVEISENDEQSQLFSIEPFEHFFPLIESGKSREVNTHFYYILLNNIHLEYKTLIDVPKLKLIITYKDQHETQFTSIYILKMSDLQSYDNHLHSGRNSFELIEHDEFKKSEDPVKLSS
ncbi:hypothetical protein U5N25_03775 [Exiguobacterium indicum]|uniref:hypothetical protein n=1 Tax=Exiguobacterium indicum TaxID=296995 RepID=UPI003979BC99